MKIKKYVALTLVVLCGNVVLAQKSDLERGNKYFDKFDFGQALEMYELAYEHEKDNPELTRRIGLCLRRLGGIDQSAEWFKKTLDLDDSTPTDMLHYAEALKSKEDYTLSVFWYARYAMMEPEDQRAQSHIRDPKYFHDLQADSLKYFVKKLEVNTDQPSFGVSKYGDGYLFSSAGVSNLASGEDYAEGLSYLDLYVCEKDARDEFVQISPIKGDINSKYHDGPAYYDPSTETIYVTRNNIKNGRPVLDKNGNVNLKIYEAHKDENQWDDIKDMPFNSNDYSTGHPCASMDGSTLYFVSNMPGGYGGTDLYMSKKTQDGWGEPQNLGAAVNTEGNEMFPFLSEDGKLFFSSDGHAGLGGLDLFMSTEAQGKYTPAINLGFPINSSHDDFGMMYEADNESGYFSSNRDGKGQDNIYYFSTLEFMKQIFAATLQSADMMQTLEGETVTMKNITSGELRETTLDAQNAFQFTVNAGDELAFYFGGKEYAHGEPIFEHSVEGPLQDTYYDAGNISLSEEAYLASLGKKLINPNEALAQENERRMKSMLELREQTNQLAADKASDLEMEENQDSALNLAGSNTIDSEVYPDPRASMKNGIEAGLNKEDLNRLNAMMSERNMGNVYFGFDSSKLSNAAKEQLKALAELIKENPSLVVQISTHTDSRGSKTYNERLSKRRAESVQRYLAGIGITQKQVVLTWHGEEQLVNNCVDGRTCDDLAHEKNRRAEFAFITEEMAAELRN